MTNSDLKNLLLETYPIRPGQEGRAWKLLQERLEETPSAFSLLSIGKVVATGLSALALLFLLNTFLFSPPMTRVSADSQSPGIFATAFYSRTAQAQVVWLNGMEPSTDRPTYLDPTTAIAGTPEPDASQPSVAPNRL